MEPEFSALLHAILIELQTMNDLKMAEMVGVEYSKRDTIINDIWDAKAQKYENMKATRFLTGERGL